ncbi:unnamed protein product [Rotaria sordida]|uniref:Uncharacterized protein n=1 Tax=Rotaria sordida TaxID=392033 RepID=A0A819KS34_9BILA|nr:unnamed protein product [Rotaria sordida]CAF0808136.1 unnamed protein product [Rotaria sordida]CAF0826165.1 unnamed protein product [Rotaria sordida]CAF0827473.1 unnamed protein product [Rotaria sordida]CAF0835237.1 unnamed protein product [Rotaria sordida]
MSRKTSRRSGGVQLEETSTASQGMEIVDSVCSQRQISDVCETAGLSDQGINKTSGNDNVSVQQQGVEGMNEEGTGGGDEQSDAQLSSSSNTTITSVAKAIPTNEADMLCTTIENVSHVRFEWTVEDFYPQMYECGDMIQSEEFPPYDLQKEFWTLRLYPKGHQRLSKEQQNQPSTGGASSTDDDSTIQFYLSLCPSHVASQHPSNVSASASNGAGSNNPNHIASSLMNTSSRQLQVYFRALINFSNPQGRIFHTETVHDCGGNITDELIIMKMSRATCEQLYKDSKDHLIISIELMSIDDLAKRSMKTSTSKMVEGSSRVVSKVMKMKLRWKIEKFSTLVNESPNNSFIESCEFTFNKQRPGNITNIQTAALEQTEDDEQLTNGSNINENKTSTSTQPTTTTQQNDIPPHQWSLILYPSGKTERFKESLSVFLEHTFGPSVRVVIRFSLIDARGRRVNTKQLPSHVLAPGERWGVGDFIKHSTLLQAQQQLFPGNELRLYCQIKILERQSIDERKYISRPLVALPRTNINKSNITASISDDPATYWPTLFYTAYLEKRMCDMYLRCGNELHSVHKLILGLRSNVLARMIKEKETTTTIHPTAVSPPAKPTRHGKRATASAANTTSESMETETQGTSGSEDSSLLTIDINDIDRKTILYFLEYVYTGGIKKLAVPGAVISHTLVIDLLTIAANYEMPDLKTYAEYYLKDIIRVDNACELLMLSDNMKSEMLKQTTCDYIANNLGNVMETTGWTELKAKQPDLIDTILKSCLLLRK